MESDRSRDAVVGLSRIRPEAVGIARGDCTVVSGLSHQNTARGEKLRKFAAVSAGTVVTARLRLIGSSNRDPHADFNRITQVPQFSPPPPAGRQIRLIATHHARNEVPATSRARRALHSACRVASFRCWSVRGIFCASHVQLAALQQVFGSDFRNPFHVIRLRPNI